MRILIAAGVTANREAGTASAVYNVADGLRTLGHSVDCLFGDDLLPRPVLLPRFTDLYMAFRLARTILQRRGFYDVVNVHTHIGFAYGLLRKCRPRDEKGGRQRPGGAFPVEKSHLAQSLPHAHISACCHNRPACDDRQSGGHERFSAYPRLGCRPCLVRAEWRRASVSFRARVPWWPRAAFVVCRHLARPQGHLLSPGCL